MASRWNPRVTRPSGTGGGPPPQIQDHFAPKIIVGNVPNGDPAVAQTFPFRYIPDTGNGAGVAQALAEASAPGQQGDVYLRPGIYDFGLPGSPTLPLAVPIGTSLRGPGPGVPALLGGNPSAGALLRLSPAQRELLAVGSTAAVRQLGIEIPNAAPGAAGSFMVNAGISGAPAFIDQVPVFVTADDPSNESLTAIFRGDFITFREVIIVAQGPYRTGSLVGIDAINPQCGAVQIQGLDTGIRSDGGSFENLTLIDLDRGMVFSGGGSGSVRISDLLVSADTSGITFLAPFNGPALIVNAQVFGSSGGVAVGIDYQGAFSGPLSISNTRVGNWLTGVRLLQATGSQLSNVAVDASDIGVDVDNSSDVTLAGCVIGGFGSPGSRGVFVRPGSENATITGSRIRNWDVGADLQSDYATLVSNNMRFNTIAHLTSTATNEVAHNQV